MRATANDQQAAQSMGISVRWIFALAWSFGAIASAIGGIVIGNLVGHQRLYGGYRAQGSGRYYSGRTGQHRRRHSRGVHYGVLENLAGFYLDPLVGGGIKGVAPFLILVSILMLKPYGLFGKKLIERV